MIAATAPIPTVENYGKNYDAVRGNQEPCIICGKGIKNLSNAREIAIDIEVNHMLSAEEAERREAAGEAGDRCSYYYVGSECAKRADVRDYIVS